MRNKTLKILAAALLLTVAAAPTLNAQRVEGQKAHVAGREATPLEVIALQTYVDGRSDTYGVKPAQTIPLAPGERARVHLVGTAMVNGHGEERPIPARFSVVAGKDQIDLVQTGPDWVVVQAKPRRDNGLAQIGYEVTGNYEMKGGLREGRITFEVGSGAESGQAPIVTESTRWTQARELNDRLYRSILGVAPQGDVAQRDLEHIYEMGAAGVRDVALKLVQDAGSRYDGLSQNGAVEVLGDLYRGLLRRTGSDNDLWNQDPGFRTNVDTLRRRGYNTMVQVIVDAGEFRNANNLADFGSLAGFNNDASWRDRPSRYAVRQN